MSYVVLARKWRPSRFEDLVGQEHVTRTLQNAISSGRIAHAFLFTGARGVGKTTSARILAKALNCMSLGDPGEPALNAGPTPTPCQACAACREIALGTDMDVQEIDGASYNGVDEVRRLQDALPYRPTRDRFKIFIVDEVHMLSQSAWNAFLKTLEEPPPHVKFIFATTEVRKVPLTILSRVQRFDFKLIPARLIADRLRYVLDQERIRTDEQALSIIAREAAGSMRDAMSLLDQVIAWGGDELTGISTAEVLGVASHQVLYDIAAALIGGDASRALSLTSELYSQGYDLIHTSRDILSLLRDLVVAKVHAKPEELLDLPDEERRDVMTLAQATDSDDLIRLHQGFSQSFDDIVQSGAPRSALEMALIRLCRRPPLIPIDDLINRLSQLERRLGARPSPQREQRAEPLQPARSRPEAALRPSSAREAGTPPRGKPSPSSDDVSEEPPPAAPASAPPPVLDARAPGASPARGAAASAAPAPIGLLDDPAALEQWSRLVALLETRRPELGAIVSHAVPLTLEPPEVVLAFEPDNVLATRANQDDHNSILEAVLSEALGSNVKVSIKLDGAQAKAGLTLHQVRLRKAAELENDARDRARSHPAVTLAMEVLGAKLKELTVGEPEARS